MKNILLIILALLLLPSCKKETTIERNLWNHGGRWDIVKYEEIVTSTWPANEKNMVVENYGIFQFNKDGTGWMIESDEYEAYKLDFKYSNTTSELSIIYVEDDSQEIYDYDLEWEKNAFTLSQSGSYTFTVYSPNPEGDSLTVTDNGLDRMTCEKE